MNGLGTTSLVILLSLTVLLPAPAMANHNSIGAHANLVTPDEVAEDGSGMLTPDVPDDLLPLFHEELPEPRAAPSDQSGGAYTGDCRPWSDYEDDFNEYQEGLRNGTACYIGYLDGQIEHVQFTQIFSIDRHEDALYPANPSNEECEDLPDRFNDPNCSGSSHNQHLPGYLMIDPDLLSPPIDEGNGEPLTHPNQASSPLLLPSYVTTYVFLFGQPHPDRDAPLAHEASDSAFATVLGNLDGACGDRTHDCVLLEPADIKRYDDPDRAPKAAADVARVCHYTPRTLYEHPMPSPTAPTPCGTDGRVMDQFLGNTTHGGIDTDENGDANVLPTWFNTMPGWYRAAIMTTPGLLSGPLGAADQHLDDPKPTTLKHDPHFREYNPPPTEDTDGELRESLWQVYAVNPEIPDPDSQLACLTPNIKATGGDHLDVEDPGIHGSYIADGLDTDLHPYRFTEPFQEVTDQLHDQARPLFATAEDTLQDPQAPLEGPAELTLGFSMEANGTPTHWHTYTTTVQEGVYCTPEGTLEERTEATDLDGTLRVDARLQANTAKPHGITKVPQTPGLYPEDPTHEQERTTAWWTDVYSFEGRIAAVLDTDQNGLDACDPTYAHNTTDLCEWEPIWDAYNPSCTDHENTECGEVLKDRGYDLSAGVGLYAVLKHTGPLLVGPTGLDGSIELLGDEDPTAQNCIVGTSTGFLDKLLTLEEANEQDLLDQLCGEADGDARLYEDIFATQTADPTRAGATVDPGDVQSTLEFTPATPAPSATTGIPEGHATDEFCLTLVVSTPPGEPAQDMPAEMDLTGPGNQVLDCEPIAS